MGVFAAPNRASVMNALPPEHRGVGSGMNSTFQNSGQVLSIGIFFTLMIIGLSRTSAPRALPRAARPGRRERRRPPRRRHCRRSRRSSPSFLGYNPMVHLLGAHVLACPQPRARADRPGSTVLPDHHSRRRSSRVFTRRSTSRRSSARSRRSPRGCAARPRFDEVSRRTDRARPRAPQVPPRGRRSSRPSPTCPRPGPCRP